MSKLNDLLVDQHNGELTPAQWAELRALSDALTEREYARQADAYAATHDDDELDDEYAAWLDATRAAD